MGATNLILNYLNTSKYGWQIVKILTTLSTEEQNRFKKETLLQITLALKNHLFAKQKSLKNIWG
jgi:hypothetical protein